MTAKQNETTFLEYAAWPALVAGFGVLVAIFAHPSTWDYIVSLAVFLFGIGVMVYQVKTGGDTTFLPYAIIIASLIIFGAWGVS